MYDQKVRTAQLGYRENLSVPRAANAEYEHDAIARHLHRARAMQAAELRRLLMLLARRITRLRTIFAGGSCVKLPHPLHS